MGELVTWSTNDSWLFVVVRIAGGGWLLLRDVDGWWAGALIAGAMRRAGAGGGLQASGMRRWRDGGRRR